MADKILHKRSLTENSIPTTASLDVGEIAINVNDGKLFVRRSGSFGDTIVPIVTTGITNSGSIIGNFTGSLFGTASFSSLAATASFYDTASLLTTSSVSNATITFTKGNGSTYPITINNVVNAQTASLLSGFNQNDYLTTSSFNLFTASYNTGSFSGSFIGTASFAQQAATASYVEVAQTASYYDTSSLLVTASISNATITITKGDSTTFNLVVNNVANAETASYILNAVSSSYASNADLFDNRNSTTFANTGSNTFTGIQIFNQEITGTHAYFSGDVVINGTASIGMLETRNQQSLVVGDKYIVIMSGATDHTTLDGSGILYGSGSTGPTTDENGANAYLRYRNAYDAVEAFPNFRVSGSLIVSSGSTITTISGTIAEFTEITASFSGSGQNLTNVTASSIQETSQTLTVGSVSDGQYLKRVGNTIVGTFITTFMVNVADVEVAFTMGNSGDTYINIETSDGTAVNV